MSTEVIVAIMTGLFSVIAVVLTNSKSNRDMDAKLDKQQAITDTKLDELTREVRRHIEFSSKVPLLEERCNSMDKRIERLERNVNP